MNNSDLIIDITDSSKYRCRTCGAVLKTSYFNIYKHKLSKKHRDAIVITEQYSDVVVIDGILTKIQKKYIEPEKNYIFGRSFQK